jgi:hypothetical protein
MMAGGTVAINGGKKRGESDAKHGKERRGRVLEVGFASKSITGLDDLQYFERSGHRVQSQARQRSRLYCCGLRMLGVATTVERTMRRRLVVVTTALRGAWSHSDIRWQRKTHDRQHQANHQTQSEKRQCSRYAHTVKFGGCHTLLRHSNILAQARPCEQPDYMTSCASDRYTSVAAAVANH